MEANERFFVVGALGADLVVTSRGKGTCVRGIRLRAFNDIVPLAPVPDALLAAQEKEAESIRPRGMSIWPGYQATVEAAAVRLRVREQEAVIVLPTLESELNAWLNWTFPPGDLVVARLNHVIGVRLGDEALTPIQNVRGGPWPRSGDPRQLFACRAQAHVMGVLLWCDPSLVPHLRLHANPSARTVEIVASSASPGGTFGMFASPVGSERLLAGRRTVSMEETDTVFVVGGHVSPRLWHWWICAVGPSSFPLAVPPRVHLRCPVPALALELDDGRWIGGLRELDTDSPRRVFMVNGSRALDARGGQASATRALAETARFSSITLLDEGWERLTPVMTELGCDAINPSAVRAEVDVSGVPVVGWAGLWDSARLECEIVAQAAADVPPELRSAWEHHIAHRLPALPYTPDLALGAVCAVANLIRGRLPDDKGDTRPLPLTRIADDRLWLIPWTASGSLSRERVIAGVVRRTVAEAIAVRAFGELGGPAATNGEGTGVADASAVQSIVAAWCSGSSEGRDQFAAIVSASSARDVIATMAQAVFDQPPEERHALGLANINPLLVVVAGGGDEEHDAKLEYDVPYWVLLAGGLSRAKAGAIAPTLLPATRLHAALEIQRKLRLEHYHPLTDERRTRIAELRGYLGGFMLGLVAPSLLEIVAFCGADRIVAFSDVSLDFLPYAGTYLGLEIPIARLPAHPPAILTAGRVVAAAATERMPLGTARALVLAPTNADDGPAQWAIGMADRIADDLAWIGLRAERIRHGVAKPDLLDAAAQAGVVFFFGHASASDHWAALDLGEFAITREDIASRDWSGTFVVLVGCETSAHDTVAGDLAWEFYARGARAVVGTSAKVSVGVAEYFFVALFRNLLTGMPVDYAFHLARQRTFLFEVLAARGAAADADARIDAAMVDHKGQGFATLLERLSLRWDDELIRAGTYSLTFILTGGIGERIV